ncbi:MAG TPA: YjgN family protein [Spirochaetota bacterium]|nr:YjgN family protein [Spirochaetota bacterium]
MLYKKRPPGNFITDNIIEEKIMQETGENFSYRGNGSDLFGIYIVNILLTVITFGIYYFWAQVKVRRYLFQNTAFMDEPFDYHATGKERFIGFLKGIGIILLLYACFFFINAFVAAAFGPFFVPIISMLVILTVMAVGIPFLKVGKQRFLLSRTSWRSLRFSFTGNPTELMKIYIRGILLSIITLGFYSAWLVCQQQKFLTENSSYGSEKFSFSGKGEDLLFIFIKMMLLAPLTMGIYYFWFLAEFIRFKINHTSIQGKKLNSTFNGGQVLWLTLSGIVITFLTLGFGLPWVINRVMDSLISSISLEEPLDLSVIKSTHDSRGSALSDGISDASDAIGAILGG